MSEELKPCPYCLEDSEEWGGIEVCVDRGSAYVECGRCGASGPVNRNDPTRDAAIAAWNRRAQSPKEIEDERDALRARVAELEAELAAAEALVDAHSRALVPLFTAGYMRGHHDTVEGGFVVVYQQDEATYFSDDVTAWLEERDALRARVTAPQAEVDACGDIIGQEHGATFGHAEIIEEAIREHQADNVRLDARVAELERENARAREVLDECWRAGAAYLLPKDYGEFRNGIHPPVEEWISAALAPRANGCG